MRSLSKVESWRRNKRLRASSTPTCAYDSSDDNESDDAREGALSRGAGGAQVRRIVVGSAMRRVGCASLCVKATAEDDVVNRGHVYRKLRMAPSNVLSEGDNHELVTRQPE